MNDDELNKMREENQRALIEAKRQKLKDDFGMLSEHSASKLPPEVENEWLSYIIDFEQQFENAAYISVRKKIGNPPVKPLAELNAQELETAIDELFTLLAENKIAIEFLGNWTDEEVYRHLTEELLDEEIEDINIEGMVTNFHPTSADYDMQFWVEDLFFHLLDEEGDQEKFGSCHDESYVDEQGNPFTFLELWQLAQRVWPDHDGVAVSFETVTFKTTRKDEGDRVGEIWLKISWNEGELRREVTTYFEQMNMGDYWVITKSSLFDDLQALI